MTLLKIKSFASEPFIENILVHLTFSNAWVKGLVIVPGKIILSSFWLKFELSIICFIINYILII